jgi:uncharacterized protein with HEPN domain
MTRSVRLYLNDICEHMEMALVFIKDIDYSGFSGNIQTHYAVIRCLEIVGEAARNIPEAIREKYPTIPWRDIVGMRNKIAHGYFDINLKTVWRVLKEDLPEILPLLREALKDFPEENK